ncbi:hypothetical protein ATANTOWER_026300 [Ataeniobius toweri]|uniref:Uncharacterized protein n=1 Tax=Ataeniobius toweri TaxID=208326 RepID=A0ABU7A3C3_9TELE|nr:hypothetical protein [Ataeniobius toweri]
MRGALQDPVGHPPVPSLRQAHEQNFNTWEQNGSAGQHFPLHRIRTTFHFPRPQQLVVSLKAIMMLLHQIPEMLSSSSPERSNHLLTPAQGSERSHHDQRSDDWCLHWGA